MAKAAARPLVRNFILSVILIASVLGASFLPLSNVYASSVITVTVDRSKVISTTKFSTGMTNVDQSLLDGDTTAVNNAKTLVKNAITYQNTMLMGWGTEDPWPDPRATGPSNWKSMDVRLTEMIQIGGIPMITLMNAPWWMKGQLMPDGTTHLIPDAKGEWGSYTYSTSVTDYRGVTYPAGYTSPDPCSARVLDSQMSKWLLLVQRTAERYMVAPYNVRYFVVWNEMKGYFDPPLNRWDYETKSGDTTGYKAKHGYTYMYNQVYNKLRSVATNLGIDPNTIKIGGPYTVINTWTSSTAGGFKTSETYLQNKPYGTYDQRDLDVVKYWLQNKAGASFIALDVKNRNRELTTITDSWTNNNKFADVIRWFRTLDASVYKGADTLPIIYIEWYSNPFESVNRVLNNTVKADGVIKTIKAGGLTTMQWATTEITADWKINPSMISNTNVSGGGQALPWYNSYKGFHVYFPSGTKLLNTTQTSSSITVMASAAKTVLVNHDNATYTVSVNGTQVSLAAYEVKFINTP